MTEKKGIKVIKRAERNKVSTVSTKLTRERAQKKTAREMVSTVTSWVNDVQRKRRAETVEAIQNLLRARRQQQPAES